MKEMLSIERAIYAGLSKIEKATNGFLCKGAGRVSQSVNSTLSTMSEMESSTQLYRLSESNGNIGTVTLGSDHSLTVNFCDMSNFIHEIAHCGQFERGEIGFQEGSSNAYVDVYDELEAYSIQFNYKPSSIPQNGKMPLTIDWLMNIYDGKKYPYRNCGIESYDRDSTYDVLNKAFPQGERFNYIGKFADQDEGMYFKR